MAPRIHVALLVALLAVPGMAEAQSSRLGPPTEDPTTPPTNNTTTPPDPTVPVGPMAADEVWVFITDDVLYGFSDAEGSRTKRLGNVFNVYAYAGNGTASIRVLFDDVPLKFEDGSKQATFEGLEKFHFEVSNIRRIELTVEITRGEEVEILDYGRVRIRKMASVAQDAEDDILEDAIEQTLRIFTPSQWTLLVLKQGAVYVAALMLGLFAGIQRGRQKEESEMPYIMGA